jgi:type I restriction enzyme M protein
MAWTLPQIDPGNALRFKLSEIGEKERVDVILTNPPFGGEEEKGIQGNFPDDRQTAETALLFLQLIMRKLKRQPTSAGRPARAAVVVPNGTLFGDGVCARIKEELLKDFQPPYCRTDAHWRICALHKHTYQHSLF